MGHWYIKQKLLISVLSSINIVKSNNSSLLLADNEVVAYFIIE